MTSRILPLLVLGITLAACSEDRSPIEPPTPQECLLTRALPAAHPISAARLAERREALLDATEARVAIVGAGWEMGHAVGDPSRQRSDFYWLTGLEHVETGWLVLARTADGDHVARLYLPEHPDDGPAGELASTITGVADVRCTAFAHDEIVSLLQSDTLGSTLPPLVSMHEQDEALLDALLDADAGWIEDGGLLTNDLRAIKDAEEIALLTEAARVTAEAIVLGMEAAAPGGNEADVQAAIEGRFDQSGAIRYAFGSIVASGTNALEWHYMSNTDPLEDGELIVVDVGTEHGRYAADVARTFPASGTFSARQRELYDLVLAALETGIDAARAGGTMAGIHDAIEQRLAEGDELCGGSCYMGHYGGHYVGLDVHDGDFSLNWDLPLVPGTVLNVEPGIYLHDEGIGIRIEETVLVTAGDPIVLSVGAPLTADDIEAAMD